MELMDDLVKERFGADAARELCQSPGLFERGASCTGRIEIAQKHCGMSLSDAWWG